MSKKSWYSITARADADAAEISVHADIGMWGIDAQTFLRDLKAVQQPTIKLSINSMGGSVFDALAMLNGLRKTGKRIEVDVLGVAASAASVLAMAGDVVRMPENTMMMVHKPLLGLRGNADDLRDAADVLDKVENGISRVYMTRWKGTEEELQAALESESYYTAPECLANGLCDEVTPSIEVMASFDPENLPEAVRKVFEAAAKPAPELPPSLIGTIKATVEAAGLTAYVGHFAADPSIVDERTAVAAVAQAREVLALCELAALPDEADGLIRARAPLAKAREQITNKLAEADASTAVNTARKSVDENRSDKAPPVFDPAAIKRAMDEAQRSNK